MIYNNQMKGMPADPGMLPSAATTTNMSLTGTTIPTAPIVSEPRTFNPGVKPSGASVNFNPKTQSTMTGVFGMPTDGSYDRVMGPTI
jgi:hypothetical protein